MSEFPLTTHRSLFDTGFYRLGQVPPIYWVVGIILLTLPLYASGFVLTQVFARAMFLGMIALSLMFLAGYGGMVSLAQMTIAGVAGYMIAIFGNSAVSEISQGWPWFVSIPLALLIASLFSTCVGWLAVRTEGIYTIMITLAIAAAFFYFTRQNYDLFNGYSGFNSVLPPRLFGVNWTDSVPFYYLCLFWALASFFLIIYISRAPFGLALQGVRDNPRRMSALGFNVIAHRVAAYTVSGFIAGVGGILLVWHTNQVSPGTVGINTAIDILVIAIVGGLAHPAGAFIGAILFVLLETFAIDVLVAIGMAGERFQLLIGLGFLIIVYFSPDGILGLWKRMLVWRDKDPLTGEKMDQP